MTSANAATDPQLAALARGGPSFTTEPTVTADGGLAGFYREYGYAVVPGALSPAELEELRAETLSICRGERGAIRGLTPALADESDEAVLARYLCIHFPHKLSEVMRRYLATPAIARVLSEIVGPNVKCMQSMLFVKATGKPGQAWHQDEDFIPTRDRSLTGGWIAMDDATVENGCLWVIPGSHRPGVLWPLEVQHDLRFDCADEATGFPYRDEDAVPVEVRAGTVVFFNGYLLHRSFPNRAQGGYRRALVNHYMRAESLLPWGPSRAGAPTATADYRDIVMVAGEDPYGWKGIEEVAVPQLRPDREGGCVRWRDDEEEASEEGP